MLYQKLLRTWSNGYINHIPEFKETFPELKNVSSEELAYRFQNLKLTFYHTRLTPVNPWVRFTLPFAIIVFLLMFIGLPIVFLATGHWRYKLSDKNIILNWFKSLKLLS